MPNVFTNKTKAAIGTSETIVYTAPSGTSATVVGLSVANVTAAGITVSVKLDAVTPDEDVFLVKDAPVTVGGSLIVVGGEMKIVVRQNQSLVVQSSAAGSADVLVSMLEIS